MEGWFMKHKLFMGLVLAITFTVIANISNIANPSGKIAKAEANLAQLTKNKNTAGITFSPKIIYSGRVGNKKLVALTIDDGPDARFTPQVLNILKKYHIKATFFVVGESIKKNPNLLMEEIKMGNEIENHTYTHPDLVVDGQLPTEEEILRDQELIEQYTHKKPHYFRPPMGLLKNETLDISQTEGYKVVLWTICVEHAACKTPQEMAARVVNVASPGTIILAHDGRLDRSSTMAALPLIINGYQTKGYRFVTLDEMFHEKQNAEKPGMVAQLRKELIPTRKMVSELKKLRSA
jgi:peptidoglycan/xylan/chitin deacetylase (PgdA/CDA1 family)